MALFPINASILLEAKKKNMNKNIKINPEESDYDVIAEEDDTRDTTTDENEDENTPSEADNTENDYTSYIEEDEIVSDTSTSDIDDDIGPTDNGEEETDSATDYTGMDDSDSDSSDNIDSDMDNTPSEDDNSYSEDNDTSTDDNPESTNEGDITNTDAEKNSLIMKDFLNLYYFSKNILEKLSSFDKGDVMVNSIVSQVIKNITLLRTKLYDYIVNSFSDKYIHNLYQYNFFIQGLNINIEMLKKIKDFNPN